MGLARPIVATDPGSVPHRASGTRWLTIRPAPSSSLAAKPRQEPSPATPGYSPSTGDQPRRQDAVHSSQHDQRAGYAVLLAAAADKRERWVLRREPSLTLPPPCQPCIGFRALF